MADKPAFRPGRGRIYEDITKTIGDTPLVRMKKLAAAHGVQADILAGVHFQRRDTGDQ